MAVLAPAALVSLLTAFYFAPATVFLFNGSEVTVSLPEVVEASLGVQAWILGSIAALGIVVGRSGRMVMAALLLALAALMYLQGNVFVWEYGQFDGTEVDYSRHLVHGVIEAIVWLVTLAGALVFRKRLWKHLPALAVVLGLLNVVSLGAYLVSGRNFDHATASGIDDRFYSFSTRQNVLVIILDAFPSPAFDMMLAADPQWRDRLDGFTYFRDALGVSPTTLPSIPAILSGRTCDNSRPLREYMTESLAGECLPRLMQENGYLSHTISEPVYGEYLQDVPFATPNSFLGNQPQNVKLRDSLRIWNVALFRYSPHFLKMRVYSDHRWLLRDGATGAGTSSIPQIPFIDHEDHVYPSPGHQASWVLWRQLMDNARVENGQPTFKFIHFFVTHAPFYLHGDCSQLTIEEYEDLGWVGAIFEQCTCALHQVLELLEQLREFGVLDDTLVILAGDHGSHVDLLTKDSDGKDWDRIPRVTKTLPLLLVKPIGAEGPLRISNAPVSLIDIPRTVTAGTGVPGAFPGWDLQDAKEGDSRSRVYFDYTWEHEYWWSEYLPPVTAYEVNGPARNPDSWSGIPGPR